MIRAYPWGDDAHQALRWAFGMLARSAAPPVPLGALRGPSNRLDLSKLDLAAQAALIRLEVDRIDNPAAKAYLWAAYLPRPTWERQPGRRAREMVDYFPEQRGTNIHALGWWLMAQEGAGQHRIRGYMEVATQFTCGEESIERLRKLLSCNPQRATEIRKRGYERLEALRKHSLDLLDERLRHAGLIGQEDAARQQS